MKLTPVGKAQQIILDKLGLSAESFQDADKIFNSLGFTVIPKRVGRSSVPTIRFQQSSANWNEYGDADVHHQDHGSIRASLTGFEIVD